MSSHSPLRILAQGLAAGAVGTAAMTAAQRLAPLPQAEGEQKPDDPWENAPAPAQVARRILTGVFGRDVSPARIPLLTELVHWLYGTGWGAAYAAAQPSPNRRPLPRGIAFGIGVWSASYAQLVPLGIYEPPWRYPLRTLALDASYHLVYGATVAVTYSGLNDRETRAPNRY